MKQERTWFQVYLASARGLTHGVHNPITDWLTGLDDCGLRSYEKHVPDTVFAQGDRGFALFLRHLWATDGCIRLTGGKSVRPAIYYATSSQRLAQDVQSLLLRLGINARLARRGQGDKGRDQFHVIVSGKPEWLRFLDKVGTVGAYKMASAQEIRQHLAGRDHNTNRDTIPASAWRQIVVPAMQTEGMTTRQMQADLGHEYCGTALYKNNLSRERAARVAEVVQSDHLRRLAESDVYWDRIVSIVPDGETDVYDLTVPDLHNFVAGNIVAHNSIEQDADIVMFIYREDYYVEDTDRQNIADVIIAKHRHGSTGSVGLFFRKELTQFRDLEITREELDY